MKLAVRIISVPRPFYSMMYSGSPVFRLTVFDENYLTNALR